MSVQDVAALTIFFGAFIASWAVELHCGADSGGCSLRWNEDVVQWQPHCAVTAKGGGLGDPALSVGSLQFAAALPYLASRFTLLPIVSTYLGIASFLFHAHGTDVHHRMDMSGVVLLAPAVFDAVTLVSPVLRAVLFAIPLVLVAVTYPGSVLLYSVAGLYTLLILATLRLHFDDLTWLFLGGVFQLIVGVVLILVGNGSAFWSCIPSQLGEPHYWGHFFAAAGTTLVSRGWAAPSPYAKLENTYV